MLCLTGARFNMQADIVHQTSSSGEVIDTPGEWVEIQNPDTFEWERKWIPGQSSGTTTTETNVSTFPCQARGIVSNAIKSGGTDEDWGEIYDASDYVQIRFPAYVVMSRRDRVTNIRDAAGNVIWKEEEALTSGDYPPTVFEVKGVTPIPDPFGRHIENIALLERVQSQ